MKSKSVTWSLILLLLLSLPIIYPFLERGIFPTQDGGWAIVRLAEMNREIRELQIPPRWSGYLNHGFGYPLFLFSYPFPYFLGEVVHVIGFGMVESIKILFMFSVIGSAVCMFVLARKMWGTKGALVSSILYLYAPYRMVNLFIRGSIGESLAFIFFPLLFFLFYKLRESTNNFYFIFATLTLAAFVMTHNAMVILFMPILVAWATYLILTNKIDSKKLLRTYLSTFLLALLLTAFFWLPAVIEKKYVALGMTPLAKKSDNFLSAAQLLSAKWSYETKPPLFIGTIHILSALLGGLILIVYKKENKKTLGLLLLGLLIVTTFLLFNISLPVWRLPLLKEIDFPWRNLGVIIFIASFISGAVAKTKYGTIMSIAVICFTLLFNKDYIRTQPKEIIPDVYFETNDATTTSADEFMPVWVTQKPMSRPANRAYLSGGIFTPLFATGTMLTGTVQADQADILTANIVYFPGWKAYVDGNEKPIKITPLTGLLSISVPVGTHQALFLFTETPLRRFANLLTLIGTVCMVSVLVWRIKFFRS